ncbi:hypothetical protein GXW84_32190 [Rhodococcus sp. IEGM 248]|nr:hypothetical protein [Rhodococcus sp. IEGM 248]
MTTMVYAQNSSSTVEAELPQVEYVWDDLECQLLAAEVDLIFADAPAPVLTDLAPTSTADVHGENTRPPLHAVAPTTRRGGPNPEVVATQRSPPHGNT